jgi:DNA recombination protein RmuC
MMESVLLSFLTAGGILGLGFLWLQRKSRDDAQQSALARQELLRELQQGMTQNLTLGLGQHQQGLEQRLRSLEQSVENRLGQSLQQGFRQFEMVQQHLQAAETRLGALEAVGQGITDLNRLLKLPHLRGGFGEAQLERLLSDFLPAGSFELQYRIDPNSTERVDAVVKLARQVLPIDSKFPREQVLPLFDSDDPSELASAREMLAVVLRQQARQIAKKYLRPEHGTTDLALLFLPSETLYFEVIRNSELFEELNRLHVYPVSPNTLSISLRSVAMAQEYYDLARGVEKTIEDVRKARKHFEHFQGKFDEVGKSLKKAQESFDTAQTHLGRYDTQVHRLTGADAQPEIPASPFTS